MVLSRQDLDPAFDDDEQRAVAVTLFPEAFTVGEETLLRERRDPGDLRRRERREDVILMGCGCRAICGHGRTSGSFRIRGMRATDDLDAVRARPQPSRGVDGVDPTP